MDIIIWSCSCNNRVLSVRDANTRSHFSCVHAFALVYAGTYPFLLSNIKDQSQNWYNSKQLHPSKNWHVWTDIFFLPDIRWLLKIHNWDKNPWALCQIAAGLLFRLKGAQQKSQSNPTDKVRVSCATFCGKHLALKKWTLNCLIPAVCTLKAAD